MAGFDFMSQPPPLCHQRSSDGCLYRTSPPGCSADAYDDEEEFPVWRSCAPPLAAGGVPAASYRGLAAGDSFGEEQQVFRDLKPVMAAIPRTLSRTLSSPGGSPRCNIGDLPSDLLHLVLLRLAPCPDLFSAGAVCKAWADAARASYTLRRVRVPPTPDALLRAVEQAEAGDTLELLPGQHLLSRELSIEKPLRLHAATAAPPRRSPAAASAAAAASSSSAAASSSSAAAAPLAPPVLVATFHILLRVRHAAVLDGLWMCRMGDEVGYPNAVVFAEGGKLQMQNCCVTCGGGAPTVDDALRVFAHAPAAGAPWPVDQVAAAASAESNEERERPQDPQSGLWVGAAASVTLSHCRIFACLGPGIKIYRGALVATHNTVGFSRRGANVVANGGAVVLKHNEIVGALGDGVSSWNNSQLVVESNRIHANAGAGIAINSGGAPPCPQPAAAAFAILGALPLPLPPPPLPPPPRSAPAARRPHNPPPDPRRWLRRDH